MKKLLILCGVLFLLLGGHVFMAGLEDFTSESARMARQIGSRLNISRPFWNQPGVREMAVGSSSIVAGAVLLIFVGGAGPRSEP